MQQPNKISRKRTLELFEKLNKSLLVKIRADRSYKMPRKYISWETISALVSVSLSKYNDGGDKSTYIHNAKLALWFVQDAPVYCLTPEIVEAFDQTDVLHKPQVMMNWKPSLPSFLLALPEHFVTPEGGKIDYLLVSNTSPEHPEWHQGQWKHGEIEEIPEESKLLFHISTVDSNETVWTSVTAIDDKGNLIYEKDANFGSAKLSCIDREFLETIRNLVLNVMLAIEHTPELFATVTESETTKSRGFATNPKTQLVRFPRWVGKNYRTKSESSDAIRGSVRSLRFNRTGDGDIGVFLRLENVGNNQNGFGLNQFSSIVNKSITHNSSLSIVRNCFKANTKITQKQNAKQSYQSPQTV
ncbi:hypothetical protein QUB68_24940 [Microcoleus sp. A006_D1]|uniref:hypothetical protein n=1 Tax=Microcoleus sp. A006_D1 TaxID=3055267 RepID=UPI002FD51E1B